MLLQPRGIPPTPALACYMQSPSRDSGKCNTGLTLQGEKWGGSSHKDRQFGAKKARNSAPEEPRKIFRLKCSAGRSYTQCTAPEHKKIL